MVINISKKIVNFFLFIIIVLFLLFWFLSIKNYENFEKFFYELEDISHLKRFGDLNNKSIIFDNKIPFLRGLNTKEKFSTSDIEYGFNSVQNDSYDAYLGEYKCIKRNLEIGKYNNLKIVGINAFKRGYAFVIKQNSTLNISNKKANPFYRFSFWFWKVLNGEYGYTKNATRHIKQELILAIPNTLFLIGFTIVVITVLSLSFSFILISKKFKIIKKILGFFLELLSSFPEFLVCFGLLYFFYFYFIQRGIIPLYNGYDDFFYKPFQFTIKYVFQLFFYYSLPTIALSFANGNISVLTKYLVEQISSIQRSENICFFKANGMKKFYINNVIIMKKILPIVVAYISMKIPLIIGSAVIVEKLFDLNGIGNMAFRYFKANDCGIILIIFLIIFITTFAFDAFATSINFILCPIKRKQTI